jgi:hypothetical protein
MGCNPRASAAARSAPLWPDQDRPTAFSASPRVSNARKRTVWPSSTVQYLRPLAFADAAAALASAAVAHADDHLAAGVEEVTELRVVVGPGAEEPREYSSKLSRP